MVMAAITQGSL